MAKRLNDTPDRKLGAYKTPEKTVKYMVERLLSYIKPGDKILDPAGGDGIFVSELLKQGVKPADIFTCDINPDAVKKLLVLSPNVEQADFLSTYAMPDDSRPLYSAIIGNPPYNCHESDYIRQNKPLFKKAFSDIGVLNTYSLFIYAAINALKEGGILCLIVMDSFMTNTCHAMLRRFILTNCRILELTLAPPKLFQSEKADVRTVIVILKKLYEYEHGGEYLHHSMRLIDRLQSEDDYLNPPRAETIRQSFFLTTPQNAFLIGVPEDIIGLFHSIPTRLGECVKGGAGISTGNDSKYLFRRSELNGQKDLVPFFKNCAGHPYYFEPDYYIERDCLKYSKTVPNFMVRNRDLYFHEGVACSSIGIRFCACYIPADALFGINACFFPDTELERYYLLGYLNSSLVLYLVRAALNRTNMVTPGYIKKLPYIPPPSESHSEIAEIVYSIKNKLQASPGLDYTKEQQKINDLVFRLYGISEDSQEIIRQFCEDIMRRL